MAFLPVNGNMEAADTDNKDVGDPITLIDYEQFGCYESKEKASNKREDKKLSEEQNLMNNKKYLNVLETKNGRFSNLKKYYECCPVSIKLVDCAKYPWYYKFNQRVKSLENNIEINKNQEESDTLSSESDVDDIICLNPVCLKHKIMHNPNAPHILESNESAKRSCLFNETHVSKSSYIKLNGSSIANGHSGTNDYLGINFKKNTGLIGIRVRRRISTDELTLTDDKINNFKARTNSMNSRDLVLDKSPVKDVTTTKPIYNKNIFNRTEPSELNIKENIFLNKETSIIYQGDITSNSNRKLKKNWSPILKINVVNKKAPNHPIKLTTNVSENDNKNKTFLDGCLEIKNNAKYFKDSKLSEFGTKISESKKSPILNSNIQNNTKLSLTPETRSKSPIFPCKNNIKKLSRILPRSENSIKCQGAINYEKNNLRCLKKNITHKQDTALDKKQKQINIFIKDSIKNKIPVSVKLNNIVESLHKRKLQEKANNISSEITNLKEKASLTNNCCKNSHDIKKVKTNITYISNHKENKIINNFSFKNISPTKSSNTSAFSSQSQHFSLHKFNCNFEQLPRYDKASIPNNFEWGHRRHFASSLTSGPVIRHQIPHKHIRIPPVSCVLLNTTKFKETLPCTYIPKQTILLNQKYKTEASKECVTTSTTNIKRTSKETVTEHKPGNVSQNNVQRTSDVLNQNNEIKGYSPPILPNPTYQTTFEYLARFSSGELYPVAQNINDFGNQTILDPVLSSTLCSEICANTKYSGWKNSFGKRKLNTTDSGSKKKISLTEYKTRIHEHGYDPIGESLGNMPCKLQDIDPSPGRLKTHLTAAENPKT